jgi:hypothetical protein
MRRGEGERAESRDRADRALVLLVGAEWRVGALEVGGIDL